MHAWNKSLKKLLIQKQCDFDLPADMSLQNPNDLWAVFNMIHMYSTRFGSTKMLPSLSFCYYDIHCYIQCTYSYSTTNFVWQAHFEIVTDLVFDIYFVILLGKCNYLTAVSVTQFLTLAFLQSDWLFRNCPSEIPLINYTMKFHSFYHKDLLVSTCFSNEKMPDRWSATGVDNKTHLLVILW